MDSEYEPPEYVLTEYGFRRWNGELFPHITAFLKGEIPAPDPKFLAFPHVEE